MYKLRVVAPFRDAPGFALAGVLTDAYRGSGDAEAAIVRALEDPEAGALIVDEAILPALSRRTVRRLEESTRPLVVPIPMGEEGALERDYLERVLRRVIGFQVRLK